MGGPGFKGRSGKGDLFHKDEILIKFPRSGPNRIYLLNEPINYKIYPDKIRTPGEFPRSGSTGFRQSIVIVYTQGPVELLGLAYGPLATGVAKITMDTEYITMLEEEFLEYFMTVFQGK